MMTDESLIYSQEKRVLKSSIWVFTCSHPLNTLDHYNCSGCTPSSSKGSQIQLIMPSSQNFLQNFHRIPHSILLELSTSDSDRILCFVTDDYSKFGHRIKLAGTKDE